MAGLYDIVDALSAMRGELRAAGDEAEKTTAKVRETNKARAEGRNVQAGIASNDVTVTSLGATASSLGDPRDATNQAARMVAAIQNATGR